MRIVVTGREGQIARSLAERGSIAGHEIVLVGRPELDLAGDASSIRRALDSIAPDAIVSAAAYTAVDRAETERDLAFAVNADGPRAIAQAASDLSVPLIHLSTDYVFDGTKSTPYVETDTPRPASVYGASKLAGEEAVLETHGNCAVLRTAWVYSPFGTNFAKTMLGLAADRDEVAVVADQFGNPTSALDIADGLMRVVENLAATGDPQLRGVFHLAALGEASWADIAEEIFSLSAAANGPAARVRRIATAEYATPAKRPANSRLDCSKLARVHQVRLPDWHSSIGSVVSKVVLAPTSMRASQA